MQKIKEWERMLQVNIERLERKHEKKRLGRYSYNNSTSRLNLNSKNQLAACNNGYRTRQFFNKKNQSTNFIQMSPGLISYAAAMEQNKRVRKASH